MKQQETKQLERTATSQITKVNNKEVTCYNKCHRWLSIIKLTMTV